jgi:DNA helicase-2/ATP-dependent DNA helicase PcrA
VCHDQGPLLILAGAGSGKTRVITHRIAHLALVRGVDPGQILAMTFTNKAATEMRERVEVLLAQGEADPAQGWPWISTFHRTCSRILRRHARLLGLNPRFVIYDESEQRTALRRVMGALEMDTNAASVSRAAQYIESQRNLGHTPPAAMEVAVGAESELLAQVYAGYQRDLHRAGCLDFGDLLLQTVELLHKHPQVRKQYQRQWRYLMVDEFQDTNQVQYDLLRLLVGESRNLAVVGDDDQAIYGWRGATVRNILDFQKDYPDAQVVKLERNYRSVQVVLDASTAVIQGVSERMDKTLWTEDEGGDPIEVFTGHHEREEASWVVRRLERLIHREGFDSRECAVFYRTNAQSRILEEQFRAAGLGYQMVGGTSFYARAEVKDVLAYLKVATNTEDNVNLLRIINTPSRGIGKRTIEKLEALVDGEIIETLYEAVGLAVRAGMFKGAPRVGVVSFFEMMESMRGAMQEKTPLELTEDLLERLDYITHLEQSDPSSADERKENVFQLLTALAEFENEDPGGSLEEFLERISLMQQTDHMASEEEADLLALAPVTMMTVHSSKGLEFDAVFVVGLEEKLFPLVSQNAEDKDMDEERRLCYVALTRARRRLFLTNARRRRVHAGAEQRETRPSRFLMDIPPDLMAVAPESAERDVLWKEPIPQPRQTGFDEFDQSVPEALMHKLRAQKKKKRAKLAWSRPSASEPEPQAAEDDFEEPRVVYLDEFSQVAPEPQPARRRSQRDSQAEASGQELVGRIAFHKREGPGEVLSVQGEGDKARLTVKFAKSGKEMTVMRRFLKVMP